ncbi:MAG: SpoIIE family protein phosphatase [Candidatus Acidiferrales bacterium]
MEIEVEKPKWLSQMEGILETLNEGVIILDEGHRILFVNSGFVEMTGMTQEDVTGRLVSDFYSAKEWTYVLEQVGIASRFGRNRYDFVLPQKDGGRLPVLIGVRAWEDPDGQKLRIATLTDVSELREANHRLQKHLKEMEEDLALAARVQRSLTPQPIAWGNMRVEASYHPAGTIGGDFGLVMPLEPDQLNLAVCDISGHGIGSALVANRIYCEITAHLKNGMALPNILRHLNRFAIEDIGSSDFFLTLAVAQIDHRARRMIFAGAGHPPVMLTRPGQQPLLLESRSMILGSLREAVNAEPTLEVELRPKDRIVLYTDGLTEVFDQHGEMLGVEGLQDVVSEASSLPFSEMKQAIVDRVAAWREGPATDDTSLVLIEVH